MRLFVAVPLPDEALRAAAARLSDVRDLGWPVRWVRQDGLHLTLKFFGEVSPDRLDTIAEMLGFCVAGMGPMTLEITGAGVFPHSSRPRVIRLDLAPVPELELLQDRIERGGEGIGFPPEGRPFHPHITLGRVREGHRLPAGALEELERTAAQPPFLADRVVLYESRLSATGPDYHMRAEFRLG
jgi:RNA 2',3'-cyclic 3'-phosphodiesterase